LLQSPQNSDQTSELTKPRRSLRIQILSIALIGTLGFVIFLGSALNEAKDRAGLLKEIRDVRYPVQESLLAALNNLEFIDSNIEQSMSSSNRALLSHSMVLAGQFRSNLHETMLREKSQAEDVNKILGQFDSYFSNAHTTAQAVISGEKSRRDTTTELQANALAFNNLVESLGNLQVSQKASFINSVDSASIRESESLRAAWTTGILIALLLFFVAIVIAQGIQRRINHMVSSLRRIAKDTDSMNVRIPLTGSDEMTELAFWFNTFIEKLQHVTEDSTAEIKRLAFTDTLTNLPNRRMFLNNLNAEIERIDGIEGKSLAVMFLDLDNFKIVNDSLGHDAGDELIRVVSRRMLDAVRSTDTLADSNAATIDHEPGAGVVARLAGDEFMLTISDLDHPEQAAVVAERIREKIVKPIMIRGMECNVGVSIGICIYPENASNADELVTCADMAMYEAKNEGKNTYRFFDPALRTATELKLKIDSAIKNAIEKDELHLMFLPKYRLSDRKLVGTEALLRWKSDELGDFSPADFISVAIANGKICELDDWVFEAVLAQMQSWNDAGLPPLEVALNFSAQQASRPNLGGALEHLATDRQELLNRLEIEITETSAIDSIDIVEANILALKKLGVKIAMDDFGTGHSSLSLLTRCPIDTLKLDREVTRDLRIDKKNQIIVESIIDLAHQLDVAVVAEGIEDEVQMKALSSLNCDLGQGFYLSELMSAEEFTAFLHDYNEGLDQAA